LENIADDVDPGEEPPLGPDVTGIFSAYENQNDADTNVSAGDTVPGLWTDLLDNNGVQVPADVALLASPDGENGYSMEAFYNFKGYCSFKGSIDDWGDEVGAFSQRVVEYMLPDKNGYPWRFNWLAIDDGSNPSNSGTLPSLYDFKPISPHRV
jgi:hypothetical protein